MKVLTTQRKIGKNYNLFAGITSELITVYHSRNYEQKIFGIQAGFFKEKKKTSRFGLLYGLTFFNLNQKYKYKNGAKRFYAMNGVAGDFGFYFNLTSKFCLRSKISPTVFYKNRSTKGSISKFIKVADEEIDEGTKYGLYNSLNLSVGYKF